MATYKESFSLHLQDNYSQQVARFVEKLRELNKYTEYFNASLDKSSSQFNKINNSLNTTLNKVNNLGKSKVAINPDLDTARIDSKIKLLRDKMRVSIGDVMGTVATAGIVLTPLKQSIEIDEKYYSIQKTLEDEFKSGPSRKELENQIRGMGIKYALPMQEAYDAYARMAQATKSIYVVDGKTDINKLSQTTELAMKMATSFGMSGEAAGTFVASMSNLLQQSQKTSGIDPIKNLKLWGDTINQAGNIMSSQATDIANVMSRVGGQFASQGWSASGTTALVSTLLSAGTEPERAATALMNITSLMTKIGSAKPPKELMAGLKALGLNTKDLNKILVSEGPEKVFNMYAGKISANKDRIIAIDQEITKKKSSGELTQDQENKLLAEKTMLLQKNNIAQDAMANLASLEGVNLAKILDMNEQRLRLQKEGLNEKAVEGSLDRETLGALELQAKKYQQLKTAITGLFVGIGETGNISKLLQTLTDITLKITDWVKAHPELVGTIGKVIGSLLALKIATMGFKFALGGVLDLIGGGNTLFKTLGFLVGSPAMMSGFASMIGMGGLGGVNAGLITANSNAMLLIATTMRYIALMGLAITAGKWIGDKVGEYVFRDTKEEKALQQNIDATMTSAQTRSLNPLERTATLSQIKRRRQQIENDSEGKLGLIAKIDSFFGGGNKEFGGGKNTTPPKEDKLKVDITFDDQRGMSVKTSTSSQNIIPNVNDIFSGNFAKAE
jgi:hypothetical protein